MNFRFTKIKPIVSLIVSLAIGIYFFIVSPGIVLDGKNSFIGIVFNKFIFFGFWFIPSFVVIYVIWSLFDKKE